VVSAATIILKAGYNYYTNRIITLGNDKENEPLLNATEASDYTGISEEFTESIKKRHFDTASLPPVKLNGEPHGHEQFYKRSALEKFKVVFEELLILVQIGLYSYRFQTGSGDESAASLVNLLLWLWLLLPTSFRVFNLNDNYYRVQSVIPNLWINNFVVYVSLWFPNVLVFRSALLGRTGSQFFDILDFAINTILLVNLLSSHVGYRCPAVYISDKDRIPAPEPYTDLWNFITFSWVNPMMWQAYREPLKQEQVWDLKMDDFSYYVLKRFRKFSEKSKLSFSHRLIMFFLPFLLLQAMWACVESFILFAPTILLKRVLEFVQDRSTGTLALAWFYVFLMFASKYFSNLASGQALFFGRRVCIRLKSVVIGEIYAKALRRKITTKSKSEDKADAGLSDTLSVSETPAEENRPENEEGTTANLGAIINLMAVDAFKISEVCAYLHAFFGAACMIVVSIYLLWLLLGWSALVGAFSIIALSPLNFKLAAKLGDLQKQMLAVTDRRIQKLNETFQSIRIIKFFAWEKKFEDQILKIRDEELSYLKKRSIVWVFVVIVWCITPTIVTLVSFGCYIFIDGNQLTTPVAFTALSLFNLLRNPLDQISDMLSFAIQSKVSLDRVQDFLNEDETSKYEQLTQAKNNGKIGFSDASFSWDSSSDVDFKLRNLNVEFKVGKLNVIIGPTGSGKTSLLMALLGEMELLTGNVFLPGFLPKEDLEVGPDGYTESVAYCSQAAWLLNDTIRNNIIFGSPFNRDRYNKVVSACGLSRDFEILKAGDQTEIGEKGIALSGGQKQRVSLARALYCNARHILLDDCLSAVDSHTALHIYENCIAGPLMKNRTVLLVSHNVALTIKSADYVVVLDNGKITNKGSPEQLLANGALGDDEMIKSTVQSRTNSSANLVQKAADNELVHNKIKTIVAGSTSIENPEDEELENLKKGKLIEEEQKSDGVVSFEVYKWFFDLLGGWAIVLSMLCFFFITNSLNFGQSWWVRTWAKSVEDENPIGIMGTITESQFYGNSAAQFVTKPLSLFVLKYFHFQDQLTVLKEANSSVYYIVIYGILGVAYSSLIGFRILYLFLMGIRASRRVFEKVLQKVLRAKLRFFDATPIGRIMNRFSKDIESVDQELVAFADGALACVVTVLLTLVMITFITPGFLFFAIFIIGMYYLIAVFYLSCSRELKRFDSITKSPIHQHFSETLVGASTIRAYGIERRFLQENLNKIDENNRPFFYMWVSNRWLSFRNDMVGALVIFFAGAFILYSIDTIDAGLAGISLSYAIAFNDSALWVVRLYANVEMAMNSVERLKEYMDIDEEPAAIIPETEPPSSWPEHGKLEVDNLSLRYAPQLPMVIKNVTFEVDPSSKIGIVGRTGAGKSTIITALFRFLDPETGSIKIDDIDITTIGLNTLRKSITIIPQDPTLFTGTIKSNLDPFDQYTDHQIFEALKRVNLITESDISKQQRSSATASSDEENANKFLNLNNEVSEGGGNLSQGQRQLMCLARSLLRSPKIMLLDEATASIDYDADAKIQQTIRQEFSNSTILTIAHRLRSIIDYDKILVMDAGEVVEFDHPYNLISNKKSTFYSMCADSGELEILTQLSKEAFGLK
jgi:ABC-type multidrug transport system fused ATPase/permease subunit